MAQFATLLNTEDMKTQFPESVDGAATHRVRTIYGDTYNVDGLGNAWVIGKDTGKIILPSKTSTGENNNVSQILPNSKQP